ncbi:MAG TPA: carboxylating nicotinate-nucleotide diphosphorylase [Fimbriiglobus sp.]|jgi:nicotinate-nucleotide pyrophosphorylase (carboxylating)
MNLFPPDVALACRRLVEMALAEDLGPAGDRTSESVISAGARGVAAFVARSGGVIAGLSAVELVAAAVSHDLAFQSKVNDGTKVEPKTVIATIEGPLRALLVSERTALNFLQRLSGIATLTRKYVEAVAGTKAKVLDTRKTTPGWRLLEKYAVRMGGGANHRVGLFDGVLIKDNHLAGLSGDIRKAISLARSFPANAGLPIEVEVDSLDQLDLALLEKPEIVLLDNMGPDLLCEAVLRRNLASPSTHLEASGGVTLDTIRSIAETGVDRISVGALTHSAPALDIALDYQS